MREKNERMFTLKEFGFYLLTILYPNYIIISYKNSSINSFNQGIANKLGVTSLINSNQDAFNFLFWASIFVIPYLAYYYKKKFENSTIIKENKNLKSRNEVYKRLFVVISDVIESKRKRFKKHITNLNNGTLPAYKNFESITQPLSQIIKICEALRYTFAKQCDNDNIKVSIIRCLNNSLERYFYHSDVLAAKRRLTFIRRIFKPTFLDLLQGFSQSFFRCNGYSTHFTFLLLSLLLFFE